jgi:transketolase
MTRSFGPRRSIWIEVNECDKSIENEAFLGQLKRFDEIYRAIVATQFNFHQSGHPGGSVSAGHIMSSLLFDSMDYDFRDPIRPDQDILSFAAGHKATGLYAMWALRDELVRISRPELLPSENKFRLRFEDLLGFRRNPTQTTPLFNKFKSTPLDGHPTPMTPFVRIATGPSGVGMASSIGLAFGAADYFGDNSPTVHMLEGEGGLTPGRVYESVAAAGVAGLSNAVCHLDWNQASIDSDRVTREGDLWGDYVQWDPMEFFYLHDWNVIHVSDGFDMGQVVTAQRMVSEIDNSQPTAIIYRTEKGWNYGISGKKSHGAGHKMGSDNWHEVMSPLFGMKATELPTPEDPSDIVEIEACFWETLLEIRGLVEKESDLCESLTNRIQSSFERLDSCGREPHAEAPDVEGAIQACVTADTPSDLHLEIGSKFALRKQLGRVLGYLNKESQGAILFGAADLSDSTAVSGANEGFADNFWHYRSNPSSRSLSMGGICEDGISCIIVGISGFGKHIGVGASYGAFMAPLGHIAARVHAISQQMKQALDGAPYSTVVLQCGHAGMKTGEDGPTHADPQAYQLHAENYAPGTAITLTPWEPQEIWPLMAAGFRARPAVLIPFVTRPDEPVLDRNQLGLAPASSATTGVYCLSEPCNGDQDGVVVLQGSGVTLVFVTEVLPRLKEEGINLKVIYVASPELFDRLSDEERQSIYNEEIAKSAMGITGFTLPTMYRWIQSDLGRKYTMHPFQKGHYLGSGPGDDVIREAGLDGPGQYARIKKYIEAINTKVSFE